MMRWGVLLFALMAVAGGASIAPAHDASHGQSPAETATQKQAEINSDPLARRFGGAFSLTDETGKRVTEADFRGRHTLIYFGFTTCADTCPIDVPAMVHAIDLLKSDGDRVQPVFITVDPADTPEIMRDYVQRYHPRLKGLTGTEPEIAAAARAYKVHRRKLTLPAAAAPAGHAGHAASAFTIDHGSLIYLMGPDGKFMTLFPTSTAPERMAQVIKGYL
jgi:protein SCO1